MTITSAQPGPWRQRFGYFIGVLGAAMIVAVAVYFARHLASLGDILAVLAGAFGFLLGALSISLAMFLAAKSIVVRRIGCIGAIAFAVPFGLLILLVLWSLFQTTRKV